MIFMRKVTEFKCINFYYDKQNEVNLFVNDNLI